MKLTHKNYYSSENKAISNSKVSDFLESKEYYKAKHIDCTIERELTSSMKIGSMVDDIISRGSVSAMKRRYYVRKPRERVKDKNPDRVVTQLECDKAVAMATKVLKSPLYKWYKENAFMAQVILQDKYHGVPVCGIADAVTVVGDTVYLDDWKTSTTTSMTSSKAWFYKCLDYGYLRQLAHYKNMLSKTWGDKEIVCRHIVISNDSMFPQVKIFQFRSEDLEPHLETFKDVAYRISIEKEWKDDFPDHLNPEIINVYE